MDAADIQSHIALSAFSGGGGDTEPTTHGSLPKLHYARSIFTGAPSIVAPNKIAVGAGRISA